MTYETKTKNKVRARLFAGGTYFRAKKVGEEGNQISVTFAEVGPQAARLIVTNHLGTGMVTGYDPNNFGFFDQSLNWNEHYVLEWSATGASAKLYTTTWQINKPYTEETILSGFSPDKIFSDRGKLSIKVSKSGVTLPASGKITIKPSVQEYNLTWIAPQQQSTEEVWAKNIQWANDTGNNWFSPTMLRQAVNNNASSWIEMPARGFDVNDTSSDSTFITKFPQMYLAGGDGFPITEALYVAAPEPGYLIHMNMSEEGIANGDPFVINKQYRWNKETKQWEEYSPDGPL